MNDLPDHAQAFVELLEQAVRKVKEGESVPEVAGELILTIRIAARKV